MNFKQCILYIYYSMLDMIYSRYIEYEVIPLNTDFTEIDQKSAPKVNKQNLALLRNGDIYTVWDYTDGTLVDRLYIVHVNKLLIKNKYMLFKFKKKDIDVDIKYFITIDKISPINKNGLIRDKVYLHPNEEPYMAFARYCDMVNCGVPIAVSHLDPIIKNTDKQIHV